jgi:2-keto-4-pentenoate hydratase/2-oxohepta-3-ene-1,7-dioic acid hydratase in catechol pathway
VHLQRIDVQQFARLRRGDEVILPLGPGDLLATGTPPGVWMGKNKFMAPGDVPECGITHLGTQRHVIAE